GHGAEYNLPFMLEKAASGRERGEEISDPRLAPKNRARTRATWARLIKRRNGFGRDKARAQRQQYRSAPLLQSCEPGWHHHALEQSLEPPTSRVRCRALVWWKKKARKFWADVPWVYRIQCRRWR